MNKAANDCASRAAAEEKINVSSLKQGVSLRNTEKEKLADKSDIDKEIFTKREVFEVEVNLLSLSR